MSVPHSIPKSCVPIGNEIWFRADGSAVKVFQLCDEELSMIIDSLNFDIDELVDAQIYCHKEGDTQGFHDIQADIDVYFQWLVVLQSEQRARYLGMSIAERYETRKRPPVVKFAYGVSYTIKDNIIQINFGTLKYD